MVDFAKCPKTTIAAPTLKITFNSLGDITPALFGSSTSFSFEFIGIVMSIDI